MKDITTSDFLNLFRQELEIAEADITLSTALATIPEWDSLGMVRFLLACDEKFGIELAAGQARQAQTVGELYRYLNT